MTAVARQRGSRLLAKRQPSVRTDDSAAEVRLGYLPTHFRERLRRRRNLDSNQSGQDDHRDIHKSWSGPQTTGRFPLGSDDTWERIRLEGNAESPWFC